MSLVAGRSLRQLLAEGVCVGGPAGVAAREGAQAGERHHDVHRSPRYFAHAAVLVADLAPDRQRTHCPRSGRKPLGRRTARSRRSHCRSRTSMRTRLWRQPPTGLVGSSASARRTKPANARRRCGERCSRRDVRQRSLHGGSCGCGQPAVVGDLDVDGPRRGSVERRRGEGQLCPESRTCRCRRDPRHTSAFRLRVGPGLPDTTLQPSATCTARRRDAEGSFSSTRTTDGS